MKLSIAPLSKLDGLNSKKTADLWQDRNLF